MDAIIIKMFYTRPPLCHTHPYAKSINSADFIPPTLLPFNSQFVNPVNCKIWSVPCMQGEVYMMSTSCVIELNKWLSASLD